ncbi:helix-turn-helix domain-containing protein [Burkholderia pseudomultivorans]|uniref:helix-turn-helix domain-containing protein n=1 Tax=Burkholderia pseudomultivorans TaxID=1207504 RepID=UPI000753D752|nr:helix-turn-helix domain-containing protein [Burkholderia pseudomultivorans]KVC21541.1 hypothetical protein WS55_20925 [Burkholderia pseudomultivorans]KVC33465.1 hypothetical protein WS56_00590 [Burkholderia pseudomultivorans]
MNIASPQADLLAPLPARTAEPAAGEPTFTFPEQGSVRARILAALLRGERLTQADALRRWSTSRLASAICQLRVSFDWPIMTVAIPVQTRDNGRTATVARYSLPAFAIQQAGERGRKFAVEAARYERGPQR